MCFSSIMKPTSILFGPLQRLVQRNDWRIFPASLGIFLLAGACADPEDNLATYQRLVGEDALREGYDLGAKSMAQSAPQGAYEQVCMACHGEKGQGKEEVGSPSIAGLPAWYIEEQFRKFREGLRGAHQDDSAGQQMRAIALQLSDDQIKDAAETVSQMPLILTEKPENEANIERGRYMFANHCMECHRYNGKGEVVFHSAQLIGLNRSYLRRQLENFHSAKRGGDPKDIYGNKMVDITSRLTDKDIEILVDYIGALAHGDDPRPARER